MFFGTYTPKLDDKGRLFLPAKFRDRAGGGAGGDARAGALPDRLARSTTSRRTERLRSTPLTDKSTRDYVRMLFAGAARRRRTSRAGSASRPLLREYASLAARTSSSSASMNRIEIWDPARWETYSTGARSSSSPTSASEIFPGI